MNEAFAQAFWQTCSGEAAAIEAGYPQGEATSIWSVLVGRKDVQARLKYLQVGVPVPESKRAAVLNEVMAQAFVNLSPLITVKPRTGAPNFDLHKASARQMNAPDIEEVTVESGGKTRRTTRIRTSDRSSLIRLAARALGVETPSDAEEPGDALTQLIMSAQGRAFPIATARRGEPDERNGVSYRK